MKNISSATHRMLDIQNVIISWLKGTIVILRVSRISQFLKNPGFRESLCSFLASGVFCFVLFFSGAFVFVLSYFGLVLAVS